MLDRRDMIRKETSKHDIRTLFGQFIPFSYAPSIEVQL